MSDRRRYTPEQRRSQLVSVAIDMFSEKGIERAGHGDIAKRASVSTATVFNYFPTKEALTHDVLKEIEAQIIAMFESVPKLNEGPRAQMLALAAAYEKMIQEKPSTIKTYLTWSVSFNPDIRPQYLDMHNRILDILAQNLPLGMQTRTDAIITNSAANQIAIMLFDGSTRNELEAFTNRMLDALLIQSEEQMNSL